jgi:hypothetical protein
MNINDNPTVNAILAAERITARTHGRDNTSLFDPIWSPAMWERANWAMRELRTAMAEGRIHYDSHDYDQFDADNPPDDAAFIWSVGSNTYSCVAEPGRARPTAVCVDPTTSAGSVDISSARGDSSFVAGSLGW